MSDLTPQELRVWLEWAGARLLALPVGRIKPTEYRAFWPDYEQDPFEVLDFRQNGMVRAPVPAASEIPIMEEILLLPNVCERQEVRRILHLRALVDPINGRYRHNWTKIARWTNTDRGTVRTMYKRGLKEVIQKAPQERVCRIAAFIAAADSAYVNASLLSTLTSA